MDVKDLSTESTPSEHSNDVSKYTQSTTIQRNRNNLYQEIGSNSSGKVDAPNSRPCAVIGPDRVIPPQTPNNYLKKATVEPWQCPDNVYHQRPPEYHKLYPNPSRNISPRQTFQENMQRIMVPPLYKNDENHLSQVDRNSHLSKNIKINVAASETKYCDVPYSVNTVNNDLKNVKSVDPVAPSFSQPSRLVGQGWPNGSGSLRHQRQYGPHELYQFADYQACVGPRPAPTSRPNRPVADEAGFMYPDPYCQEPNIRYKPYPNVKERYPPPRYDYSLSSNYPYPFHPNLQSQRYEMSKSMPAQPFPGYPHLQYTDSRLSEHMIDRYARPVNAPSNCGPPYNSQIIHPVYGPLNNYHQNKLPQYPLDGPTRPISLNKLPYDGNGKVYIDYENSRLKNYHSLDNYYANEPSKFHALKSQGILPNYPQINLHSVPPNPYHKKDINTKPYEHASLHFNNTASRNIPQFSSNTLPISPSDSVISSDTTQTHGSAQEDCGYSSQSSSTSVRSMDSVLNRIPNEYYLRHEYQYSHLLRNHPGMSKPRLVSNNGDSKSKKNLNVRQFLQMWNEGDDEGIEVNSSSQNPVNTKENAEPSAQQTNNQEQLYVLGLVNVPSEELDKYEHIQKVSKLPENIKGYSNLELLNQFEQAIGTTQTNSVNSPHHMVTPPQPVKKLVAPIGNLLSRPLSPLDVEAKISQSVIHKEVGCNFEIKPCSPKMLNVEIATPVQNIIRERIIEKIANPHSQLATSPLMNPVDDNISSIFKSQRPFNTNDKIPSCKMVEHLNNTESMKSNYTLQDFESNSGVCLASLPRLDNDIEFNFPEVNQQFVNANKGTTGNLPILDKLQTKSNDKVSHSEFVSNQPPSPFESETIKLSKYRKTKPPSVEVIKNDQLPSPTIRTDSVIIKNPENVKNQNNIKIILTNNNDRTYLGVHSDDPQRSLNVDTQVSDTIMEVFNQHDKPNDFAIDFSLKGETKMNQTSEQVLQEDIKQTAITKITKENSVDQYSQLVADVNDIKADFLTGIDDHAICESENKDTSIFVQHKEINEGAYASHGGSSMEFKLPDLSESDNRLPEVSEKDTDIDKICDLTKSINHTEEEPRDYKYTEKESEINCNLSETRDNLKIAENKPIYDELQTRCIRIGDHNENEGLTTSTFVDEEFETTYKLEAPIDSSEHEYTDEKYVNSCYSSKPVKINKERKCYENELETGCDLTKTKMHSIENKHTDGNFETSRREIESIENDYVDDELERNCKKNDCIENNYQEKQIDISSKEKDCIENNYQEEKFETSCKEEDCTDNNNLKEKFETNFKENDCIENNYSEVEFETSCEEKYCIEKSYPEKEIETSCKEKDCIENNYPEEKFETSCKEEDCTDNNNLKEEFESSHKENDCIENNYSEEEFETSCEEKYCIEKSYPEEEFETSCNEKKSVENSYPEEELETIRKDKYCIENIFEEEEFETSCKEKDYIENNYPKEEFETSCKKKNSIENTNNNKEELETSCKERQYIENKNTTGEFHQSSKVLERIESNNAYTDLETSDMEIEYIENKCTALELETSSKITKCVERKYADHEFETTRKERKCTDKKYNDEKLQTNDMETECIESNYADEGLEISGKDSEFIENKYVDKKLVTSYRERERIECNSKYIHEELEASPNVNQTNDDLDEMKLSVNNYTSETSYGFIETDKNIELPSSQTADFTEEPESSLHPVDADMNIETGQSNKNTCKTLGKNLIDCQEDLNETTKDNTGESNENIYNKEALVTSENPKNGVELQKSTSDSTEYILKEENVDQKESQNNEKSNISYEYFKSIISSRPCSPLSDTNSPISNAENTDTSENYIKELDAIFRGNDQLQHPPSLNNKTNDRNITDYYSDNPCSPLVNEAEVEIGLINNIKHSSQELPVQYETKTKNNETSISKVKFCSPFLQKLTVFQSGTCTYKSNLLCTEKHTKECRDSNNVSKLIPEKENCVINIDTCHKNDKEYFDKHNTLKLHNDINVLSDFNNCEEVQDYLDESHHTILRDYETPLDVKIKDVTKGCRNKHTLEESVSTDLEKHNINSNSTISEITAGGLPEVPTGDGDTKNNHDNITFNNEQEDEQNNLSDLNKVDDVQNENSLEDPIDNIAFECNNTSKTIMEKRVTLKRSFSDTALDKLKCGLQQQDDSLIWPTKRKRIENTITPQDFCNILQSNRRNSISSIYNEENVSYCILIDNSCIIAEEENVEEKLCYTDFSEVCMTEENNHSSDETIDNITMICTDRKESVDSLVFECREGQSPSGSWVEDVACIETVVSDDITDDVFMNEVASPSVNEYFEDRSSNISSGDHLANDDYDYGIQSYTDDESLVQTLYSANLTENKSFNMWHVHSQEPAFDRESLEKILSDTQDDVEALVNRHNYDNTNFIPDDVKSTNEVIKDNKENVNIDNFPTINTFGINLNVLESTQDEAINSFEPSIGSNKPIEGDLNYVNSSSPEVSSTTSEDKGSNILLKIKNYKGSKISQINEYRLENESKTCKHIINNTNKDYLHSSISDVQKNRPLITKAAQKYIPPLRESIGDLKVKLVLPQHSLLKLKKMKMSKDLPKPKISDRHPVTNITKKSKPKFEDVLMSIDEIQFKMHKDKNKKVKKSIPKMIIKKAENGSHYTSTAEHDKFNPDLTGRRWQPWVFLEKNQFIDKMALKKKVKAIFNHRKNTYVLAEKFHKYKSIYNTNFVISKPKQSDASKGHLKYTIRLKHD